MKKESRQVFSPPPPPPTRPFFRWVGLDQVKRESEGGMDGGPEGVLARCSVCAYSMQPSVFRVVWGCCCWWSGLEWTQWSRVEWNV